MSDQLMSSAPTPKERAQAVRGLDESYVEGQIEAAVLAEREACAQASCRRCRTLYSVRFDKSMRVWVHDDGEVCDATAIRARTQEGEVENRPPTAPQGSGRKR